MAYDNSDYWVRIHQDLGGLRAVGWPDLSEEFNRLKYYSEATSVLETLESVARAFRADGRTKVRIMEIGAGTGYWLDLVEKFFRDAGLEVELTALDISQEALDRLQARKPGLTPVREDLKTVDPDRFSGRFDLVMAFYVLHHLPRTSNHLNALRLAARSVAPGGRFVLMDPILTQGYSTFDVIDWSTYGANGVPRHLYFIDDILDEEGLRREEMRPAVSYLLNGPLEAKGRLRYRIKNRTWSTLRRFIYPSDRRTSRLARFILGWDERLKRRGASDSSAVCRYLRPLPQSAG